MLLVPSVGWKVGAPPLTFVASATARGNALITINKPAGTQTGDLLVAVVGSSQVASTTMTLHAGFTLWTSNGGASPFVYYRYAVGGEAADYSWTMAAGNNAGAILTYRNATDGVGGTVSLDNVAPSITPAAIGTLLGFYFITNNVTVTTPPSGMTQRAFTGGANPTLAVYEQESVGPSATGTKTITWSGAGNARSVLCHIEQA